jgi:hypothetical protein
MREELVEGLLRGSLRSWAIVAALWLLTTALVVFRRAASRPRASAPPDSLSSPPPLGPHPLWLLALLGATTATSIAGLPLASAIAIPRVRFRTVASPEFVVPSGETWRRLRGPAVQVQGSEGLPDIAVPIIDSADRWVLFGLLSGAPIQGFAPAPPAPLGAGVPRICENDADACRPWPAGWPDPSRPLLLGESTWSPDSAAGALAYDVEAGTYLRQVLSPSEGAPAKAANIDPRPMSPATAPPLPPAMIEVVGRFTTNPPREGTTALFIVRSFAGGRFRAMRVVSGPFNVGRGAASAGPSDVTHSFYVQRAAADLATGRRVLQYFARPTLGITSFALPAGLLAYVLAPLWIAARRRRDAESSSSGAASLSSSRRAAVTALGSIAAAIATFAAGLAMAAPAAVAIASLWASR